MNIQIQRNLKTIIMIPTVPSNGISSHNNSIASTPQLKHQISRLLAAYP